MLVKRQVRAAKLRENSKCQLLWRNLSNHVSARSCLCVHVCVSVWVFACTCSRKVYLFLFNKLTHYICHYITFVKTPLPFLYFVLVWVDEIKIFSQCSVTFLTFNTETLRRVQDVSPTKLTFGDLQV